MRHYFLVFILLIFCCSSLHGQDNILIYSKNVSKRAEKTQKILRKSATYLSVDFVDFNFDKILELDEFVIQLDERIIPIKKERIDARGINNFVFFGSNPEGSQVLLSVFDNDIQGVIETDNEVFTIETVGKKQYALITVDYTMMSEACDNLDDESRHNNFDNSNSQKHNSSFKNDDTITTSPILKSVSVNDCKIRVLVLYTQNAQSMVSNIKNTILTAVALTNQSFQNSQINYQIELVYAGLTNYSESGFSTDLYRFRTSGDGYMDDVHTLRDKYSADVCVLLINDSQYCGLATGIGVSEDKAFCAVSTYGTCATTNYSFGHEIGHLLGCRHDPYVDSNTTPFPYGHGYVNPSNTWRTIMAYSNACGFCPRLLYWSNPNVVYNGAPMGTIDTNDNTRVWNERSNTVMAFRQPDSIITFTSSDIPNTLFADIIAKQHITTSGTVNTSSGSTLNMRAGNSIVLQPGFSVEAGAEFSAVIENIDDCEECTSDSPKVIVQDVSEKYDNLVEIKNTANFSCTVFTNPSNDSICISYSLDSKKSICIEMLNLFGQKIKTIQPKKNQQAGTYSVQLPISNLPIGTSFLTISSNNQIKTVKITIKK